MHASSSIPANAAYLEQMAKDCPEKLAQQKPDGPEIIGAVYIHPSAHVDPTAKVKLNNGRISMVTHVLMCRGSTIWKIGPNVSIGPRVTIGKGVRIKDSIILDNVQIGVSHSRVMMYTLYSLTRTM